MHNLTLGQREELEALAAANDALQGASFMLRRHWVDSGYSDLVAAGLVAWGDPPKGFSKKMFAGVEITPAGRAAISAEECRDG